jgi:hypothetical protein
MKLKINKENSHVHLDSFKKFLISFARGTDVRFTFYVYSLVRFECSKRLVLIGRREEAWLNVRWFYDRIFKVSSRLCTTPEFSG